ncbi:MAG: DUF2127 domain-containing protein [Candidatus Parcubacteria bacterium]|nr:DUF2127 domain-containing protein [Candidatus Parcubacteria bacterium]
MFYNKNNTEIYSLFFRIGMWWRMLYGFLRLISGLFLLHLVGTPLADIFYKIMSHELIEDPNDLLIRVIGPLLQNFSFTVNYFIAVYLVLWGIIDIFLSVNLLKRKKWAFPISIYAIGILVLYEIYRFSYTHSFVLACVIIIDIILIWLIRKEYHKLKR